MRISVLRLVWSALENKVLARVAHLQLQGDATPSAQSICHLSARLEAGRAFLDTLVSISTQEYFLISLAEWTYLPRIVMDISKLSTHDGSHPPTWNVQKAQDRVQLGLYLDSLCYRMQNLTTFDPLTQPSPDYWLIMKKIMQSAGALHREKASEDVAGRDAHALSLTDSTSLTNPTCAIYEPDTTTEHFQDQALSDPSAQQSVFSTNSTHLEFPDGFWVPGYDFGVEAGTSMLFDL